MKVKQVWITMRVSKLWFFWMNYFLKNLTFYMEQDTKSNETYKNGQSCLYIENPVDCHEKGPYNSFLTENAAKMYTS